MYGMHRGMDVRGHGGGDMAVYRDRRASGHRRNDGLVDSWGNGTGRGCANRPDGCRVADVRRGMRDRGCHDVRSEVVMRWMRSGALSKQGLMLHLVVKAAEAWKRGVKRTVVLL